MIARHSFLSHLEDWSETGFTCKRDLVGQVAQDVGLSLNGCRVGYAFRDAMRNNMQLGSDESSGGVWLQYARKFGRIITVWVHNQHGY